LPHNVNRSPVTAPQRSILIQSSFAESRLVPLSCYGACQHLLKPLQQTGVEAPNAFKKREKS
jgi:hypothetical protein